VQANMHEIIEYVEEFKRKELKNYVNPHGKSSVVGGTLSQSRSAV